MEEYTYNKFGLIFDMESLTNNLPMPEMDMYSSSAFTSSYNSCYIYYMIPKVGKTDVISFGNEVGYAWIHLSDEIKDIKIENSNGDNITSQFSTKAKGYYDLGYKTVSILVSNTSQIWGDLTITILSV